MARARGIDSPIEVPEAAHAIPNAGRDFAHLLDQEVVIAADESDAKSGAQRVEPDHSPVAPSSLEADAVGELPRPGLLFTTSTSADVQREVEQFLYQQAELLDGKHWQAWIDLFDEAGVYWMPSLPEQTEWEGSASIFAEDKLMMEIRKGRVSHPNAWSQAPLWQTSHLVGHVAIEAIDGAKIQVRSRFHMMELRRDQVRHFGGTYRHTLLRTGSGVGGLRIKLQRVDLFNAQAPFDYVLQVWV